MNPRSVGQKVVCVKVGGFACLKKDCEYTIQRIIRCCGEYVVEVGASEPPHRVTSCYKCYRKFKGFFIDASFFAAVQENFQAITYEKVIEENLISVN